MANLSILTHRPNQNQHINLLLQVTVKSITGIAAVILKVPGAVRTRTGRTIGTGFECAAVWASEKSVRAWPPRSDRRLCEGGPDAIHSAVLQCSPPVRPFYCRRLFICVRRESAASEVILTVSALYAEYRPVHKRSHGRSGGVPVGDRQTLMESALGRRRCKGVQSA